jgi:hypothetical protein
VPRSTSSFPPNKSRDQRIKGNYYIKLRNAFIKTRASTCTSQKILEESHISTQLRKIDLIMGNTPQQPPQQPKCWITSISSDVIKYIATFLNHDDALSLNQTCKLLRKHVPHKCLPPSIQVINVDDLNKLKNGRLAESEALILDKIPLKSKSWIRRIKSYCPKLKYLFIKYSCKSDVIMLNFEHLLYVELSMKIKMLEMGYSLFISNLPRTLENFTAHISMIDSKAFKTTSGEYIGGIDLETETLENLKSL